MTTKDRHGHYTDANENEEPTEHPEGEGHGHYSGRKGEGEKHGHYTGRAGEDERPGHYTDANEGDSTD